jgi:hypothetical protein
MTSGMSYLFFFATPNCPSLASPHPYNFLFLVIAKE